MRAVVLISTGGTIASTEDEMAGAVNADLSGEALLARLHRKPSGIAVRVETFDTVNSFAFDLTSVHRLCRRIEAVLAEPGISGVVVTHGTDTMEESAYLTDLLVNSKKPVIFTGAQRHADEPDTDGPRNISDAIDCAACAALRDCGTLVLFEGDIHAARDVSKTHTSRVDAFRSAGLGKLGEVDMGRVCLYRRPLRSPHIATDQLEERVEMMLLGLGSTPGILDHCLAAGIKGVVLSAFGRGNAPRGFATAVARLTSAGIPVVIASRCAEGRTSLIYGGDSGAHTLANSGALFSGTLSAIKTRLLLSAVLGANNDTNKLKQMLQAACGSY